MIDSEIIVVKFSLFIRVLLVLQG